MAERLSFDEVMRMAKGRSWEANEWSTTHFHAILGPDALVQIGGNDGQDEFSIGVMARHIWLVQYFETLDRATGRFVGRSLEPGGDVPVDTGGRIRDLYVTIHEPHIEHLRIQELRREERYQAGEEWKRDEATRHALKMASLPPRKTPLPPQPPGLYDYEKPYRKPRSFGHWFILLWALVLMGLWSFLSSLRGRHF